MKCHCYSAGVSTTEPVPLLSITPVSDLAQASLEELAPRTLGGASLEQAPWSLVSRAEGCRMLRKYHRPQGEQEEQGEMAKEQVTFQTGLSDCSGGCRC